MGKLTDFVLGLPGIIFDYAGAVAPNGFLLCYGQAVSRVTYVALFNAIGTTFGAGDGTTTFNVPDLRGRAAIGKDNMGGVAASLITTAVAGFDGTALGAAGGAQSITLTSAQIPSHNHPVFLNDPGHTHTHNAQQQNLNASTGTGGATGLATSVAAVINSSVTGITVRDTTGGAGTANQTAINTGGGSAHANVQPAIVLNKIIKT